MVVYVKPDFEDSALIGCIAADEALRDVRDVGHYGTGNLEIRRTHPGDFEPTQDLIAQ